MYLIDIVLYLSYALTILAMVAAIVFPIINAIGNPEGLKKSAMGMGGLVALLVLSYVIAGSEVTPLYSQFGVDAGMSKIIGGVIIMMYLLFIAAVVGVVYTETSKMFKK